MSRFALVLKRSLYNQKIQIQSSGTRVITQKIRWRTLITRLESQYNYSTIILLCSNYTVSLSQIMRNWRIGEENEEEGL